MIEKKLIKIFSLFFKIKDKERIRKLIISNEKKWDSLLHIKLILCFEDEYQTKLCNHDIEKLDSFQKIINYISKLNLK